MDFDQNLNLTFRSTIGRGRIPLIHDLLSGVGEQIVLIHVGGTLSDPKIRQEPLPNLKKALKDIEEGVQGQPSMTRRILDPFGLFPK